MDKTNKLAIIPVMLCFFAMGFVDLVGTASNFVKADLGLNDAQANIFPSLVFFWFLIFSVPTGMLMNKIGRKKTVLLSLIITFISLLLPLFGESFILMLIAFSLLGIGNALMQTYIRPGYQGHSIIPCALSCHMGCHCSPAKFWLGMAHSLPYLHGHWRYCHLTSVRNTD